MKNSSINTIRVPNPFVEGRNCVYVIKDDPITMIDSGIATDRAYNELVAGLKKLALTPHDIQRIILTHKHIDHIGNAWRIQSQSNAEIFIHESERTAITHVDPHGQRHADVVASRLDEWNVSQDARPPSDATSPIKWEIENANASPIVDGQKLSVGNGEIEAVHTPGHTMGSICLRFERYVFSGDHILPDISPNIGGGDLKNCNLLLHYLQSLHRVLELTQADDSIEVLPGHGKPMPSIEARCQELITHHNKRLDEVVSILKTHGRQTVFEIAKRLFGEMESFHVVLGCAETNAHLELLIEQDRIRVADGLFEVA